MGDEHFTYYMTDAGETIVRDSLGYRLVEDDEEWQALLSEANGRRKAVRRKVGSAANAPLGQHWRHYSRVVDRGITNGNH